MCSRRLRGGAVDRLVSRPGLFLAVLFGMGLHGLFSMPSAMNYVTSAVCWCAIFVVAEHQRPHPRRSYRRRACLEDAADDSTIGKHVEIVVTPLAGWAPFMAPASSRVRRRVPVGSSRRGRKRRVSGGLRPIRCSGRPLTHRGHRGHHGPEDQSYAPYGPYAHGPAVTLDGTRRLRHVAATPVRTDRRGLCQVCPVIG